MHTSHCAVILMSASTFQTPLLFALRAAVVVDETFGLSGSETVGVIIAIVSGGSILIIMVLLLSMACRYLVYRVGLNYDIVELRWRRNG